VLGANGAGKTTLLRAISGIQVNVTRGAIEYRGSDLAGVTTANRTRLGLGHVPEGRALHPGLTTFEHLVMGGLTLGRKEAEARIGALLEQFPVLRERAKQHASELSGGEQQILAVARALVMKPQVLMLDEPCTGLAPLIVEQVMTIVGQLRDAGTAVLLIEQNAVAALGVADRALVLEQGQIVLEGSAEDLRSDDRLRSSYLGGSSPSQVSLSTAGAVIP
jgi:branched-chain amino acid transport system ATP-binding protein